MDAAPAPTFADLLRRYRLRAGLTQEELAERAGLTAKGIGALERGERLRPHRDTLDRLAMALQLSGQDRDAFEAARRRGHVQEVQPSPWVIYQGRREAFPGRPAGAATRHYSPAGLPSALTPLIGREGDEARVVELLRREGTRLVTLTGAGGVGKTRLAVQVATTLQDTFGSGIFAVPLAAIREPGLVVSSIAASLGLRETGDQPLLETVAAHLQDKQLLLLDNFEQVIEARLLVVELLARCPELSILVTSRMPLHVRGEQELEVASLGLPEPGHAHAPVNLLRYPAVALFLQHARAVKPEFEIRNGDAGVLVEICRRLDGLPLAIELAAARVKVLPLPALLARLEHRLQLLTGGPRDLPLRQQTMRDTIAWSYDLLDEEEQQLFRRLAVFVGGFSLETAEEICRVDRALTSDMLDGLTSLVDKHLLAVQEPIGDEPRFGMLETIREYGLEQLAAAGEEAAVRDEHLAFFLTLAEESESRLSGPGQEVYLARLEAEHDNLRAALRWAREPEAGHLGLRLASALGRFWTVCGYLSEGRRWLEAALAGDGSAPATVRATALNAAGNLALQQGDFIRSQVLHEEALALRRALGNQSAIASSLNNLGVVARGLGDYTRAVALHEESLALKRTLGDKRSIAYSLANLGQMACIQGDYDRAAALNEEALGLRRELGDRYGIAVSLYSLGDVAYRQSKYEQAATLIEEGLPLSRDIGARNLVANELECLAWVAAAERQPEWAARLGGAAEGLREALAVPVYPEQRADHDRMLHVLDAQLGAEVRAAIWAEGRALPLQEAVAVALEGSLIP